MVINLKKLKWVFVIILILITVISLLVVFLFINQEEEVIEPLITSATIEQSLVGISEVSSIEYNYTNVGSFEDSHDLYGWSIPFTEKFFIVSYEGRIKAGIDFSKVEVDVNSGVVVIELPEAEILSHEIFEDRLQVFDQSKNIFNQIEVEDYATFATDQKSTTEEDVISNGLLEEAKEKCSDLIEAFLTNTLPADYIVKVL